MNRWIAAVLVTLSVLAGVGVGYAAQRDDESGTTAPGRSPSATPAAAATPGGSTESGPVTVTDAYLVASRTGGATLSAVLRGPSGVAVNGITAEIDGRPLMIGEGYDGNELLDNSLEGEGDLRLGEKGVDVGDDFIEARPCFVVHDVEVGQRVRVTLDLDGASDAALEVPVVTADQVDDVALFEGPPPKITEATIAVYPGEDDAPLGFTIVSRSGDVEEARLRSIVVEGSGVPPDVRVEHHTATGGPSGFFAQEEPLTVVAARPSDGDYDFVDARVLTIGSTVTLRIPFPSGVTVGRFRVVAG